MKLNDNMRRINNLMYEIDSVYHQAALKFGIADSCLIVLYAICTSADSVMLSNIYKQSGTSKQTLNSALRKLEKDGYIVLDCHDGRAKIVRLTKKGREFCDCTVEKLIQAENQLCTEWGDEKIVQYESLTKNFLDDIRQKVNNLQM